MDFDRVVANLRAAIDFGVYVYSFEQWDGARDMVDCAVFRRLLDVVRFYTAAAAEGQVVVPRRG